MGMYTELHFNASLKENIPKEIIDTLSYMLGDDEYNTAPAPFVADGWRYMLTCDSYYFSADTHSTLRFDEIAEQYYLCIRCNLKNYDEEIEKFIKWIMPYTDSSKGDFLGFYRYEETENPTLIFNNES